MTLSSGTRLGVYEVLSSLGAGGMGEVYRARDTKLNRDVAIKILPEALAHDPERLARFEREAQMLAALNHPHIAQIYGLEGWQRQEEQEGRASSFIVMELVDGLTLADRIARGPIALEDTLPIAKQIADALEAAHEHGIVHRDLKPANIKVRHDGTVKVLDFGLAKAFDPGAAPSVSAAMSPTLSIHATQAGIILGSAAYMAPEQARGKPVDKRADIWAFGAVVFEMLTATRAFDGDDISVTLASVLKNDPDWSALPASVPTALVHLLKRCLQKDSRERLRDVGEARIALERTIAGDEAPVKVIAGPAAGWRRDVKWAVFAVALTAAAVSVAVLAPWRTPAPHVVQRYSAEIGADASLMLAGNGSAGAAATVSPDGTLLAFVAQKSGAPSQLYVRRLDQLKATLLPGTEDAVSPFFSPDGQWIAFFAGGKLKKISVSGGAAVTVCGVATNSRGGSWADDGTIVFQPSGASGGFLLRVPSAGGTPEPLTTLGPGEQTQRWPQVLSGGRGVIYTSSNTIGNYADATVSYQPLPSGPKKVLIRGGYFGRYFPSGHLVYVHDGVLFAAPFDVNRLEVTGQAVPVLENIGHGVINGSAQFAASSTGTLAYVTDSSSTSAAPIVWLDRQGKTMPIRRTPADWSNIRISPDGERLALDISDGRQTDIWLYDWARDSLTRLTLDPGEHWMPVWTPDARRITFRWNETGSSPNLFWRRADGGGDVQRLTTSPTSQYVGSWHPSGKLLALSAATSTGADLMMLPMDGDGRSGWRPGTPTTFLKGQTESEPAFSPDGRWIAYQSNESGLTQVYVRPFPGPGGKWLISTDGGTFPVWSRARKELLYAGPDNRIMMVSYTAGETFSAEKPRPWAETRFLPRFRGFSGGIGRSFDLHPDGERVAIAPVPENEHIEKQDKLIFILNFFDELRRIAPASKP